MNYLAHAWLSFNQSEILVGNMISDFVKGKKRFDFAENIQNGIILHRNIDAFTDAHGATRKARTFFKPAVGLYAGAFVDVVYDHFLATDANEFADDTLMRFSLEVYTQLEERQSIFPEKFATMFPYMKRHNWLYNYKSFYGIERSFEGLLHRAKYLNSNSAAFACFIENYEALQNCYAAFSPDVKKFARHQLQNNS